MLFHQAFLENLLISFEKASQNSGILEQYFKIGPHIVRMRFAGIVIAATMTQSIQHLAVAPVKKPSLSVFLWDDATTKTVLPPFPWIGHSPKRKSQIIENLNTQILYTSYNSYKTILNVYDQASQTAFFWVPDARQVPSDQLSSPLRNIFHKFLKSKRIYLVHAAAVGTPRGGIFLAGKGGVGKSTSALSCLDSELSYAGDDYILLSNKPQPKAYSVYSSAKLNKNNLWRVPNLKPYATNQPNIKEEKALIFLNQSHPEKLISQFPLRAIFLPQVTNNINTTLTSATTKEAINALLLSTVAQFPQTDPKSVKNVIEIIQSIPTYRLQLGTQMEQLPKVIINFLKSI